MASGGTPKLNFVLNLVDVVINSNVFRKISQSVANMPQALQAVSKHLNTSAAGANKLNASLAKTTNHLSANEKAARLFLQRMSQFAILLPTFATLNRAIQGGVKFLFEFDSALRDIVRVDVKNLSDRMEEIGDSALGTAVKFGVLAQEVLNTQKVFVQAGLSIEDAQKRTELAILATQTSTLSSANAIEFFIAAATQFKLTNQELADSLDALVKVEDLAAVEAEDIGNAFSTGGNSLAEFGKDINDVIGLISALREQTRKSGNEIGTFFKTLQTRIFAAGEARDALESLGVSVENLDGSLRPTLDVLTDLKVRFDDLTESQKANAAKAIGGVRQFESLIATLNSVERANELSKEASLAAGAAEEKRIITDAKLERQIGKLIAQGQALAEALGDAGVEDALGGALKFATLLLKAFTSMAKLVESIGGNITPLLALGGVTLGKSIFGLKGDGAPGGPKQPAPGQSSFIGPLTQSQKALTGFGTQLGRTGTVIKSTASILGALGSSIAVNATITKAHGLQLNADTAAIDRHGKALTASVKAIVASEKAALKNRANPLQSSSGTLLLSLVGTVLPAAFEKLANSLRGTDTAAGNVAGEFLDLTSGGASMAAQFAVLGGKAAGVAGLFGILQSSLATLIPAIEDEFKARDELAKQDVDQAKATKASALLTSGIDSGIPIQEALIESLRKGVEGEKLGKDLAAGIQSGFEDFTRSSEARGSNAGLDDIETVRNSLLESIGSFRAFVHHNQNLIESLAEGNNALDAFAELQELVANGTNADLGDAFNKFLIVLGAAVPAVNEYTGALDAQKQTFEELSKIRDMQAFADGIRTLGLELEVAKLGPAVMADAVVKMTNDLLIAERESGNTIGRLEQQLGDLFANMNEFAIGLNPAGLSAAQFFLRVNEGVKSLDPDKIAEFEKFIEGIPAVNRKAADEIMGILEQQLKAEIDIQNQRNDLQAEVNRRQAALLEEESKATQNAFETTRKFTAELVKFGEAVNTEVLAAFQGVSLDDVNAVLGGTSELSAGLQDLIINAFSDPVIEAEQELQAVTAATQAELDILAKKLAIVTAKMADESNAANIATLTGEQRAIELAMENAQQQGLIETATAKIKILKAEQKALEEAAEAERKRKEALEKLADASRAFDKELKEIERDFEDFAKNKMSDLLEEEADAQNELKEAQQEVLGTTQDLAEAYDSLIKAQFEFNGIIAEAKIKSNLLAKDIGMLTGTIFTFSGELSTLGHAFRDVLDESNISLQKRIDLEQQLAEETLAFLQQAQEEIVQAGLGIFGQTGTENQELGQGIAGLQLVADTLGGSFEAFLSMTEGELTSVSETLLSLPAEFRQQILDALSFLPSTMNIGGFSVDQLTQAIGQVGAGVAPEAGLPSIEELSTQQVEQLTKLQELALQDAQLQFSQVAAAQDQLAAAEEAAEAAQIMQERSEESLGEVRDAVLEEAAILEAANIERTALLEAVVAADDKNTLLKIEKEAQQFAEQNSVFREVGDTIVQGISAAIGAKLAVFEAAANLQGAVKGYIPNFAGGNLTPAEAAGLLKAGSREKKAMPGGAGLAVANTSEAIIPMNKGFIPNFEEGNFSAIAAGIAAIKQINETVVAAIARSVTTALADLNTGGDTSQEVLNEIVRQLTDLNDTLEEVSSTNTQIQTNTSSTSTTGGGATATAAPGAQDVNITLQTNQNNVVTITGLENLREQVAAAIRDAAVEQVERQLVPLLESLDSVIVSLQERGLVSSILQPR